MPSGGHRDTSQPPKMAVLRYSNVLYATRADLQEAQRVYYAYTHERVDEGPGTYTRTARTGQPTWSRLWIGWGQPLPTASLVILIEPFGLAANFTRCTDETLGQLGRLPHLLDVRTDFDT